MWDTIAAISSGKVNQAVSIIRICGPEAIEIIKKIFVGKEGKNKEITFGYIHDNGNKIDEVLVAWFPGNKNYIGEDTIEINAHGGIVVTNMILELILANGARMADPGEFSRRAFLNGKIDLIKAEAINDLIHAQTKKQAQISIKKFDNRLSSKINGFIDDITYLIGNCEVNIDYPEIDDIEVVTEQKLKPVLSKLIGQIEELINLSNNAQKVYEGIKVAIVGKPNVGKSSLLNSLLNEEKAIVTEIAGTTRDVVEGSFKIDGILFKLIDTAGIRQTEDIVEKIGIDKAKKMIESSDVVLHVIDTTKPFDSEDKAVAKLSENKIYIPVYNKIDASGFNDAKCVKISAKNGQIEQLEDKLKEIYKDVDFDNPDLIYSVRQLSLLKAALINLKDAQQGLEEGFGPEVVIVDITEAWENVGNIIGRGQREDLLDSIFGNFCLGK